MDLKLIQDSQKIQYNKQVTHVIQSFEWGEFRKTIGTKLLRYGLFEKGRLLKAFSISLHPIPFTNQYVGYLPKGPVPDKQLSEALKKIGRQENLAFIKIEPNITIENLNSPSGARIENSFRVSPKPLFTKYNFILDLTKSEDQLLKDMHPKTRYNIRVAKKHGVKVEERTDEEAFNIYLKLYFETTKRQGYHGHNESYHKLVWEVLKKNNMARLLIASYRNKPLTAWMLFNFKDTLYYPYGGSSKENPEVMANNLIAWEAIILGKRLKLKRFDMWGALGPNAPQSDPWYGFHRFKLGYGGSLEEYIGTYDLVFNYPLYLFFTAIDKITPLKVFLLKLIGK